MKRTFKSTVEPVLLVPAALVLIAGEYFLIQHRMWIGAAVLSLAALLLCYLYVSTFYVVTADQKLSIRSVFYRKDIYIRSIKRIRRTKNHLASPALSGDRIEIQFNRYESVMISPKSRKVFIEELRKINPAIKIAEPSKL